MNTILKILGFSFAVTFINFSFGQATAFPAPIALAASWDTSLVYKVGKAIALEARDKGRNVLLAPCVNILRHPLGGRNFETYGEDPYLAAQMADAFIKGVQSEPVISSVKSGAIDVYVIDDQVRRLLRAGFDTGLFDKDTSDTKDTLNVKALNQLALQAARESIVLLKNHGGLLPLHKEEIESIALIGPNTYEARVGGGGSSQVNPRYAISPYAGIQKLVGDKIRISSTYGIAAAGDIIPLGKEFMRPFYPLNKQPGLKAEYFANAGLKGPPALTRVDSIIDFVWGYDSPHPDLIAAGDDHNFSVRWSGKLIAASSGIHKLNILCNGACRLYIKEELLIDDWQNNPDELRTAEYTFESGQEYDIIIEYLFESGIANIKFGWELPGQDLISAAVYHARNADVAIVFAGLSNRFESESFDRKTLDLPNQEILIKAVVEANPNTIVVMETGSPVVMEDWIRDVPAVLQAWYPGQEGGNAIAEVLFGDFNPTGRLPFTIAWNARDYPVLEEYQEDIYIGYRYFDKYQNKPLFSFGHGLSYSIIGIGKLLLHRSTGTYNFYATIEMKNMGKRKGTEILQLYIHDPDNKIARPEKELKRFKRITLEPGEKMVIRIPFNRSDFAHFNEETGNWAVEPGIYEVMIGTSADNIKLRKKIEIK